jgi:hypothetical protein
MTPEFFAKLHHGSIDKMISNIIGVSHDIISNPYFFGAAKLILFPKLTSIHRTFDSCHFNLPLSISELSLTKLSFTGKKRIIPEVKSINEKTPFDFLRRRAF